MYQSNNSYCNTYNDHNIEYHNDSYLHTFYHVPTSPKSSVQNFNYNYNSYDVSTIKYPTSTPRGQQLTSSVPNGFYCTNQYSNTNQIYSTPCSFNNYSNTYQSSLYSHNQDQNVTEVNNDSGYQSSQYYNNTNQSPIFNDTINFASNKENNDSISVYSIQKVQSKKRKFIDNTNDNTEISIKVETVVDQILQDAMNDKIQKEQQVNKLPPTDLKSKRPKIYKLDVSSTQSIIKNGGQLACSQCNLTFISNAKLLMHQHKYHGNGSSTECPICHKRFGNQANTLVHLRGHTQEKNYKCTVCDNAFCDSSTLKKHMRIHTGDKPYECHLCNKRFTQSGNLNRHVTTHAKYPQTIENNQLVEFNINFDFLSNNL